METSPIISLYLSSIIAILDGSKEESFKKEISASALGTHLISLTVQAFPNVYGFFKTPESRHYLDSQNLQQHCLLD